MSFEHRLFNLEVARFAKRFGHIHDQEIVEQQLGQRMVAVLVERPVDFIVQAIVEREIGVEPRAIRADVGFGKIEGVLFVIDVSDLKIPIYLIEHLRAERDVLHFRPPNPF